MCKFHKDVAISVAADTITGHIDPVRYSLTICALAKFWVNKYMPDMGHLDGYSNYELSTASARRAFASSGLPQDVDAANDGSVERIQMIRNVIDDYVSKHHITAQILNVPKAPDKSPRFLDQVMMGIYEGDPSDTLHIKSQADNPKHEPIRSALEGLYQQEGFSGAIEGALKTSISNLFLAAPQNINQRLLSFYDRFPTGLRTAFASCSFHGGGGALAHVVVCGGLNAAIGGFSGAFMNAAMYGVGPAVALATTYAVEKYRINEFNPYKYVLPVALSLGAAFGISKIMPHEHSQDPRMAWFYSFNAQQRYEQLQKDQQRYLKLPDDLRQEVAEEASKQNMTTDMFMTSLEICGGDLIPKIKAFEAKNVHIMPSAERGLN